MTSRLVIVGVGTATLPESADTATTCPSGEHHRGNDCVAHSERSTPIIPGHGSIGGRDMAKARARRKPGGRRVIYGNYGVVRCGRAAG